jgi:hypothetical protein
MAHDRSLEKAGVGMSIEGLFDHWAEVWRPLEARGPAGEVSLDWDRVHEPTRTNCAVVPLKGSVENIGPGETVRGREEVYLGIWVDVQERDVVRLTAGPEAGRTFRAVGVTRPRGHHVEAMVEPIVGALEGVGP